MSSSSSSSSSSTSASCKISMLWNWYTIDSCFLARSWHVRSKSMFAGSCIGVFFFILAYYWVHRVVKEYDNAIVDYKTAQLQIVCDNVDNCENEKINHSWLFTAKKSHNADDVVIMPSIAEHSLKSLFFMVEWTCSYLIMLLWMYYNGYIIITCILGCFFGKLLFGYEPLAVVNKKSFTKVAAPVSKCCC
ncbi:copper transporter family protein [Ascoidea rubescens DSM 1968]|uniref:Copper transport protein n=1 Tax=Ascoidea rubescens DSM 1968 TaxID=1344418 RepID=A0A1D2VP11_9ASCO|nr:Ctr copper transporter [Ascoidea rubescens DSM 1968]ODV63343.1 Ctr copper transporter [Ascoidea rubescens DSM 1968]